MGFDSRFVKSYGKLLNDFAAVPGSLKDRLNTEELGRIAVAALTAGGGHFGLLEAISAHAGTIFPAPTDAGLAAVILTTILESRRRLGQGVEYCPLPRRSRPAT